MGCFFSFIMCCDLKNFVFIYIFCLCWWCRQRALSSVAWCCREQAKSTMGIPQTARDRCVGKRNRCVLGATHRPHDEFALILRTQNIL